MSARIPSQPPAHPRRRLWVAGTLLTVLAAAAYTFRDAFQTAQPQRPAAQPELPEGKKQGILAALRDLTKTPAEVSPQDFRLQLGEVTHHDWQDALAHANRQSQGEFYWLNTKQTPSGTFQMQAIRLQPAQRFVLPNSAFLEKDGFRRTTNESPLSPFVVETDSAALELPAETMGRTFLGQRGQTISFVKKPNIAILTPKLGTSFKGPEQLKPVNDPRLSKEDLADWLGIILANAFAPGALEQNNVTFTRYHEGTHQDALNYLSPGTLLFGLYGLSPNPRFPGQRNAMGQGIELFCDLVATAKMIDEPGHDVAALLFQHLQLGLRGDFNQPPPAGLPFRDLQTGAMAALCAHGAHVPQPGQLNADADVVRPKIHALLQELAKFFSETEQKLVNPTAEGFLKKSGKITGTQTLNDWLSRQAAEEKAAAAKDGLNLRDSEALYAAWSRLYRDMTGSAEGQTLISEMGTALCGKELDALNQRLLGILGYPATDAGAFHQRLVATFQGRK